jgi:hypothetical protein
MAGYYAWSNFPVERNEWGQPTKVIEVGDSISMSDLGVSKEEWEALIESGAVSEEEYPDIPDSVSPAEYEKDQAVQQATLDELQTRINEQKEAAKQATTRPAEESTAAQPKAASTAKNG